MPSQVQKRSLAAGMCAAALLLSGVCVLSTRQQRADAALATTSETCDAVACPADRCGPDAQQQCGAEHPYQCLAGGARFGCSDDATYWTTAIATNCGSCCDVRTCAAGASLEAVGGAREAIGGARDAGGCLTAAGYSWCAATRSCVREWVTPCPR
mmetsp:Transcript_14323/g.42763  ORF Transcript_14323/g.42763 Transcript_14323/m.42763 type:complete len:155 (-) Transcript_14323:85-549(-)